MNKKYVWVLGILLIVALSFKQVKEAGPNLVDNPSFSEGESGWDFRPGTDNFHLDSSIYYTGPYSFRADPGDPIPGMDGFFCTLGDGNNHDRSIWQSYHPEVEPNTIMTLSAYVRHNGCEQQPDIPGDECPLDGPYVGDVQGCCMERGAGFGDQCHVPYDDWDDRGGARLGVDFYSGGVVYHCMVIYDWSMPENTWSFITMDFEVPTGITDSIVWLQGHQCTDTGSVWFDDVYFGVKDGSSSCNDLRSTALIAIGNWIGGGSKQVALEAILAWAGEC